MSKTFWTKEELDRRFREMLGDDADESPQARKRRRILKAAYEQFLSQGYRKTSIDDIARKAEVAKGTVYLYFENKGQLLLHAIALEKKGLVKRLEPIFDGTLKGRERLFFYLEVMLTAPRDLPLSSRLLTGDNELMTALEDIGAEELLKRQEEGASFLAELIEDAAPGALDDEQKRLRAQSMIALGMTAAKLLDERVRSGRSLDEMVRSIAEMLIGGIAGRRDEPSR